MVTKWKVNISQPHEIEVSITPSGKIEITVDSNSCFQGILERVKDSLHNVMVEDKKFIVRIRYNRQQMGGVGVYESWESELWQGGYPIEPVK
jgi:hypothetical protein